MKNWIKNLLFVIFSFVFLGIGMLIANILIHQKGNPLKDPNFLADISVDSVNTNDSLIVDSTDEKLDATVQIPEPIAEVPRLKGNQALQKEILPENRNNLKDYEVIVGMFGNRSNANKQLKKLKEFGFMDAYIYPKLSMNVVSAGKFDKSKAEKIASDLGNKGFEVIVRRSLF